MLDKINFPSDIRTLEVKELAQLCSELRDYMIKIVSETGGHLGASLGVVELTIALHYVFNTPDDKLVWDVGHQTYPHKILTGRKDKMLTIRKKDGLSGFTKMTESAYDTFGAGHSSTSISAALGMAVASNLNGEKRNVVAVIGDGAMSAGMAYEAINHAGHLGNKICVILNDNDMSISKPTGALRNYLCKLISSKPYLNIKDLAKKFTSMLPNSVEKIAKRAEDAVKDFMIGGNMFEELGFCYLGPIDGHDIENMVEMLTRIRDNDFGKPVMLHVVTKKGHGYTHAEASDDKFHGVSKFDICSGKQSKSDSISFTDVFSKTLIKIAEQDEKVVAITAAMPSGTGLDKFSCVFPDRTFDVGIAEQHAVTFAAGLATSGIKPFCAIYSTFLQRAYDQVIHDVAIQKLPVRFMIDRAGFVGADGATHNGCFDSSFLSILPDIIIMSPYDSKGLQEAIITSWHIDNLPSAVRYPRGNAIGISKEEFETFSLSSIKPWNIGESHVIQKGKKVCIIGVGIMVKEALKAAEILSSEHKIEPTIIDARFIKPLDQKTLTWAAESHEVLIIVEESVRGGYASAATEFLLKNQLLNKTNLHLAHIKDEFFEQDDVANLYKDNNIDAASLASQAMKMLKS